MTVGVIIQARTGSSRFPRKIYEDLNGKYTLQRVLEGTTSSKLPQTIVLAMPKYDQEEFEERREQQHFSKFIDDRFRTYFGSSDDLVDRYFKSARKYGIDLIVRVTADCPMIQGQIIDDMVLEYLKNGYTGFMGCNSLISPVPYPEGTDIEIFPYWMLAETWLLSTDPKEREHVTPYMYSRNKPYPIHSFINRRPNTLLTRKHQDFSFDTEEDRQLLLKITKEYDQLEKSGLTDMERLNKALLAVE